MMQLRDISSEDRSPSKIDWSLENGRPEIGQCTVTKVIYVALVLEH
jgi:hypothetical protein